MQRQTAIYRPQPLSDSRRQRRPAGDAKRHIRAERQRQLPQFLRSQPQPAQGIYPTQIGRRIAAAAAQSRLGGNIFLQRHGNPRQSRKSLPQQPIGFGNDILPRRHPGDIVERKAPVRLLQCQAVAQADALQQRFHRMVAVRAAAGHA